jgi:hypothetical protein
MAALAGMLGKSMAKSMAKSAARKVKSEARDMADDLKKEAIAKAKNYRNQAQAKATNYLDAQKHRIYETSRGAVYANTSGGNKNYRPTPVYRNVPGSNVVTPVTQVPQMFTRR